MPHARKAGLMTLAFMALTLFVGAATAHADIIVYQGVNNQGTDNVLLNPATNVSTVTGTINGTTGVEFVSNSGNLNANPSGQAVITPGDTNPSFTDIGFSLTGGGTFTRAVFNVNSAYTGDMLVTITGINLDGGTYTETFAIVANGQNFFTFDSINGQLMLSITLTAQGAGNVFEDLRQVRIGEAVGPTEPVPEPTTMFLLGTGLVGIAAKVRRRRKAAK